MLGNTFVGVSKQWHRLPREVVEPPFLEIFKSYLDMVMDSWLQIALLEQMG